MVKHVYKDFVFIFNPEFDKTSGVAVEKTDNCAVLAKTSENMSRKQFVPKTNNANNFNGNAEK